MTETSSTKVWERPHHFDRQGRPMSFEDWCEATQPSNFDTRRKVAVDITPAGHRVSTVWLGLDHRFDLSGPPLIFETMVFSAQHGDQLCLRWSTEAEAIEGHRKALELWRDRPADHHGEYNE